MLLRLQARFRPSLFWSSKTYWFEPERFQRSLKLWHSDKLQEKGGSTPRGLEANWPVSWQSGRWGNLASKVWFEKCPLLDLKNAPSRTGLSVSLEYGQAKVGPLPKTEWTLKCFMILISCLRCNSLWCFACVDVKIPGGIEIFAWTRPFVKS